MTFFFFRCHKYVKSVNSSAVVQVWALTLRSVTLTALAVWATLLATSQAGHTRCIRYYIRLLINIVGASKELLDNIDEYSDDEAKQENSKHNRAQIDPIASAHKQEIERINLIWVVIAIHRHAKNDFFFVDVFRVLE